MKIGVRINFPLTFLFFVKLMKNEGGSFVTLSKNMKKGTDDVSVKDAHLIC